MSGPALYNDPVPEPYGFCEYLRFNISALDSEETYSPVQAFIDIYTGFKTYFRCWTFLNRSGNSFSDLAQLGSITWGDIAVLTLLTLLWSLSRVCLCRFVFEPFAKAWKMHARNAEKFPESAFKTFSYTVLWGSAVYVTFFRDHQFFNNTLSLWKECRYHFAPTPLDLRLIYGLEASFYVYSVYTVIFMDKWKRDSPVMLLHHLITLVLICFSYSISHLKIGILIFVLNDISDVLLELAKCFTYMKVRGARFSKFWGAAGIFTITLFGISWLVFRNLFHLTKVWRSSSYGSFFSMPYLPPPMYLFFNVLLGSLYVFYMYWFCFIVIFMVRMYSGKMKDLDDIRDEEIEKEYKQHRKTEKLSSSSPSSQLFAAQSGSVMKRISSFVSSEKTRKAE